MTITSDELERRIKAARLLRHMSQAEMDSLGHADGLGRQELSRLERGELPLTRVRRDALTRILRVPVRWLLDKEIDEIVGLWAQLEEGRTGVLFAWRLIEEVKKIDAPPEVIQRVLEVLEPAARDWERQILEHDSAVKRYYDDTPTLDGPMADSFEAFLAALPPETGLTDAEVNELIELARSADREVERAQAGDSHDLRDTMARFLLRLTTLVPDPEVVRRATRAASAARGDG